MGQPTIALASGNTFNLLDPWSSPVLMTDIAHALSNLCRFTGHTKLFYSVAQHSVLVSRLVPAEDALAGLLHDAAEAYLGDVSSPLKKLLPQYKAFEVEVEKAIFSRFGLAFPLPESVKHADLVMFATEQRDLMCAASEKWDMLDGVKPCFQRINPVPPGYAYSMFMARYFELVGLQ